MLFIEFRFLLFAIVVIAVTWSLRRNPHRKIWLLLCSYFFYGAWNWKYLSLIWISTLVDYFVGLGLERTNGAGRRRLLLAVSICSNLGILGTFKYFNFFMESAVALLDFLGLPASSATLHVLLPVGISFYTFQTMSYSIDVYRRKMEVTHNILDFALFVAFFPQLVAGPIMRAHEFLPQLKTVPVFDSIKLRSVLVLFLVGFFKKACVSDNVAPFVDLYFDAPQSFDALSAWIATLLYSVQIYCDFSGYSDMAVALAAMLGYRLRRNFDFPYFSTNLVEFWRRWHITLSFWLRDYLYIALGGNRKGPVNSSRNVMVTMLLGGLWHGAAWTFVVWGFLHGIGIILHRVWSHFTRDLRLPEAAWRTFATLLTFCWWSLSMLVFRSRDLTDAWTAAKACLTLSSPGAQNLPPLLLALFAGLALVHYLSYRGLLDEIWERLPAPAFAVAYGAAVQLILTLMPTGARPFIYFQF